MCLFLRYCLIFLCLTGSATAFGNWTMNLGYRNPPGAQYGLNFLYWGSQWGFELGVGYVDLDALDLDDEDDEDTATAEADSEEESVRLAATGAVNVKYFMARGTLTPYLQGGLGAATALEAGDTNDLNAGVGGIYGGLGLLIGSPSFHVYGCFLIGARGSSGLQAGLGFDI